MPRDRHQRGRVELTGKRVKKWKGHYYVYVRQADGSEKRKHRSVILGAKSQMRKWEAESELRREIERETGGQVQPHADETVTLAWFIRERYVPMREGAWRASTRRTNLGLLEKYVLEEIGEIRLCDLDKFRLQHHINKLSKRFSFSVVDHVRNFLKSILDEAVELDFLAKNPARRLVNGEARRPSRRVLSLEQLRCLLASLTERDRVVALIAATCALRPGELFALRWQSFQDDHLQVSETVYAGRLRGVAKTAASIAPVVVPASVSAEIRNWRICCSDPSPLALMFATSKGTPIRPENFLRRRLKPAGARVGCGFVNFQVLRRTFATLAHDSGASLKDVQAQLRHTDAATTANIYTQAIPASVREAVESLTGRLLGEQLSSKVQ